MKVLLLEHVINVWKKWEIKEAKPAYAANMLLPKWLAVELTPATEKAYKEKPDFNTAKELTGTEFGKEQLDNMIKNANNLLTLFNKK